MLLLAPLAVVPFNFLDVPFDTDDGRSLLTAPFEAPLVVVVDDLFVATADESVVPFVMLLISHKSINKFEAFTSA